MKIIVCIKQVPNTTEIKIDPITGTLNREGAVSIMNPDDKVGLEFALCLKDAHQAHITVVSMGPPQAKKVLYEALAMGADRAMLLTDRLFAGSDSLATSLTLAGLLKTLEYDLIITGRQAIDGDTAQVGPQIAEHLGIPQISYVNSLKFEDGYFIAVRQFEDRYQTLKATAPLLVTILGDAAKPRSLHVGRLIEATETESVELKGNKPQIIMSRTSEKFLEKLFEQEIPEVFDGLIMIKKVVRIPGEKAKVAVDSYDDRIDPVGACVGMKGSRIHGIVRELGNENIDVINQQKSQLVINRISVAFKKQQQQAEIIKNHKKTCRSQYCHRFTWGNYTNDISSGIEYASKVKEIDPRYATDAEVFIKIVEEEKWDQL